MDDILKLLVVIFLFGVPSISLAFYLVVHPLVKEITSAIRDHHRIVPGGERNELSARLARVEERLEQIGDMTDRLVEADRFNRELQAGSQE
jgi:hypothetical protein